MAAIGGVLAFGDGLDMRALAGGIGRRMATRSPDGQRQHVEPGFSLLHGALHATPECARAAQPLASPDWLLAVDGRIDDRPALLQALAPQRPDLADAELFLLAWQRWGAELWRHVVGDYALAAWHRHARRLWLLRDRVGVRPLYDARTPGLLAFASEQEALPGLPGVSAEFDDDRIAYYLAPAFVDDDLGTTWFRDVRRLEPGTCLQAGSDGDVAIRRYWRMQPLAASTYRDAGECVEAFTEVFDRAVACRLRAPARPGLMLSGGIDSAAILAASMRLDRATGCGLPRPVSIVDSALHPAEAANIAALSAHAGDPILMRFPEAAASAGFQGFATDFWQDADGWSAAALPRLGYRIAREAGLRVMLDGIDGDLALAAPPDHAARLLLAGRPHAAWHEARASARHHTDLQGRTAVGILARGLARRLQPGWLRGVRLQAAGWRGIAQRFGPAIDPGFARRLALPARLQAIARTHARAVAKGHAHALVHAWWSPGFTRSMEGFDAMASREGIEPRHPWADLRVLEFLLRLPDDLRVRDGWTKFPARAMAAPEIGDTVAWHAGKAHYGQVVAEALLHASADRVRSLVADPSSWLAARVASRYLSQVRVAALQRDIATDPYALLEVAALVAWRRRLGSHDATPPPPELAG